MVIDYEYVYNITNSLGVLSPKFSPVMKNWRFIRKDQHTFMSYTKWTAHAHFLSSDRRRISPPYNAAVSNCYTDFFSLFFSSKTWYFYFFHCCLFCCIICLFCPSGEYKCSYRFFPAPPMPHLTPLWTPLLVPKLTEIRASCVVIVTALFTSPIAPKL